MTIIANNAHNYTKINYIYNDLLHVLANNVDQLQGTKIQRMNT